MAGALDLARAERVRRQQQTEARRAAERAARQKQAPGAPQNKMLPGPPSNKGNPAKIAQSQRPELAGVAFASAPARVQAEEAGLTAIDFPEEKKRRGVTARDVRTAVERRDG